MSIYGDIRYAIEQNGGAAGPTGSFNKDGGEEIVVNYDTPDGPEDHHVVPYLIGLALNKAGTAKVKMLLAWKYQGTADHPAKGFRCYRVSRINSLPGSPASRPSSLPKVKIKRQTCVDEW